MSTAMKFKVWNKYSKEFTYFDTPQFTLEDRSKPQVAFKNFTPNKIMLGGYGECQQYLARDKNKADMYSGDRVRAGSDKSGYVVGELVFDEDELAWCIAEDDGNMHTICRNWELSELELIEEPTP